jgi:hypothetical protein
MPRLSNDERNRAVTMLLQCTTEQEVATALGDLFQIRGLRGSIKNVQFKNGA